MILDYGFGTMTATTLTVQKFIKDSKRIWKLRHVLMTDSLLNVVNFLNAEKWPIIDFATKTW